MCRWDRVEDCTFWRLRQQLLQQPLEANAAKKVNVEVVFDEVSFEHVVVTTTAATVNRSCAMMLLLQQLSNEIRTDWPWSNSSSNKKKTTMTRKRRITLM